MKNMKGITLIALVVTVIVLLILAGITISVFTGNNGIINQSKEGKEQTEIEEEKEMINTSVAQAIDDAALGNLKKEVLQNKLDENTGTGKTEVLGNENLMVVKFIETNRYYEIDGDGKITGPKELASDNNAGDISKGGQFDGSEDKPFQINCIEDLVAFSIMSNGGNEDLNIQSNNFPGQYVNLMRSLDFQSIFSYNDYKSKEFGDLNNDGTIEGIMAELTNTTEGCMGFTPIGDFRGILNGKNNSIENLYENRTGKSGLFGTTSSGVILKDLTVTGKIISTNYKVGGICAEANDATIINCHNKIEIIQSGKISSQNPRTGGIAGEAWGDTLIIDCSNEANIESDSAVGGIVGVVDGKVINCYNSGKITGKLGATYGAVGGIAGYSTGAEIYNCFNTGEITNQNTGNNVYATAGGIIGNSGQVGTNCKVINSYNIGKVNYTKEGYGGIVGGYWYYNTDNTATLNNTYYQEDADLLGYAKFSAAQGVEKKTREYMHSNDLVLKLNDYIENNTDGIDTSEWKKWKLGENNYPIFE